MDNEQFERQMEFILEQQAKFSANLEKLQERDAHWEARHADWETRHAQWETRMATVDRQIEQLVASVSILRDALIGLTHHMKRHDQRIAEIGQALAEQAERGKETDARLNALMLIVERHISSHQ